MARREIDHFRAVAMGIVPGWEMIDRFGRNTDVDSAAGAQEDLWNGGGLYAGFPVGDPAVIAEKITVTSSSAADTAAGTGMRAVRIWGLNELGLADTEDIVMSGTTPAVSVKRWYRVNLTIGLTAGSGGTNAGNVTFRHQTTTANVFSVMPAGYGTSYVGGYTIPADKEGLLVSAKVSVSNNQTSAQEITGCMALRGYGGMWVYTFPMAVSTQTPLNIDEIGGAPFPPLTDMIIRTLSATADNLAVTGKFELFTYPVGTDY